MRLIDADALKKRMVNEPVKAVQDVDFQAEWFTRIADTVCHMIDMVDDAPTVPAASPWHRVEDELPPKATWVLTVATDGNVKLFNIATVDAGGQWWTCSPQNILRELYGVRYWMPIEPPEEDA